MVLIHQLADAFPFLEFIQRFAEDTHLNLGGIRRPESLGSRLSAMQVRLTQFCVVNSPLQFILLKLIAQGPQGIFLDHLHRLTKRCFTLRCARFEEEGYVLLWPEFNDRSAISIPRFRDQFNRFRAFLLEWLSRGAAWSKGDKRERIDIAYQAFIKRQDYASRALPLPEGFDFDYTFR
jgi:hypothetical protein